MANPRLLWGLLNLSMPSMLPFRLFTGLSPYSLMFLWSGSISLYVIPFSRMASILAHGLSVGPVLIPSTWFFFFFKTFLFTWKSQLHRETLPTHWFIPQSGLQQTRLSQAKVKSSIQVPYVALAKSSARDLHQHWSIRDVNWYTC